MVYPSLSNVHSMFYFISVLAFTGRAMSQHVCCPAGSWGELKNPDYVPKGVVEKVGELDIYKVMSCRN